MFPQAEHQLRQVLLEAVDEGLLILGESSRKAIYFHLQHTYSLTREDIPDKPNVFAEDLRKIFGDGAKTIEESIVQSLYRKLGTRYTEKKNYRLEDYVKDAIRGIEIEHSNDNPQTVFVAE